MIRLKSKEDIAILREGGKRHASILRELASMVKPGVSAADLESAARKLVEKESAKAAFLNYRPDGASRSFPAALCVSVNDEVVHGIPNEKEKILKEGDIVSLDLGLVHKSLVTDAAITVAVGKIDPELEKLINVTKEALLAGIKAAKGGKRISDISNAIERKAVANGYGVVETLAGHGVGFEVHEDPAVPNFSDGKPGPILKPGMVIAIEPMFNLGTKDVYLDEDDWTVRTSDGKPSAHFEHTVLITKGEAEILTS